MYIDISHVLGALINLTYSMDYDYFVQFLPC